MLRIVMTAVLLSVVGCQMLAGVDEKGTPTGTGLLDALSGVVGGVLAAVGGPTGGAVGGRSAAALTYGAVKLRSYLIKKAGRKDDNGNGVPDDSEKAA